MKRILSIFLVLLTVVSPMTCLPTSKASAETKAPEEGIATVNDTETEELDDGSMLFDWLPGRNVNVLTKESDGSDVTPYADGPAYRLNNWLCNQSIYTAATLKANTTYTFTAYFKGPYAPPIGYNAKGTATDSKGDNWVVPAVAGFDECLVSGGATQTGGKWLAYYTTEYTNLYSASNASIDTYVNNNTWRKFTFTFTTIDETEYYIVLGLAYQTSTDPGNIDAYMSDVSLVEELPASEFSECNEYVGSSIRRGNDAAPQALRFKFEVSNEANTVYENLGYELSKYGVLVARGADLTDEEFVHNDEMSVDGHKLYEGVSYDKKAGIDKKFSTLKDSIVYSFALYNIGVTQNGVDYGYYDLDFEVRPYAVYTDSEGNEYVYYDEIVEASVFDVADAILDDSLLSGTAATYGNTSSNYAALLTDITTARSILTDDEVNAVYATTGHTALDNNTSATGFVAPVDIAENIEIHTQLQLNYLNNSYSTIASYANGTAENSRPVPVNFSWGAAAEGTGQFLGYLLTLSENSDLSNGKTFALQNTYLELYNLKIGTDYYWNVTALYSDCMFVGATDKFSTVDTSPRNLYISGVTNARDIGGWTTVDGNTVNQDLLFRTGSLNGTTEKGNTALFDYLGVKTEIDLRLDSEASNTFGSKINYVHCPMNYDGNILAINSEAIIKVFKVLGDKNNYPIVFHCSIGTDRTGMVAFLMNGLLGASEEYLYRDYLYSNFGSIGSSRSSSAIGTYLGTVGKCKGDTLSEQIYNYLIGIGVEADDIDTFIEMMTM